MPHGLQLGATLPLRARCSVCGIGFVDQPTRVLATAFCTNEYLDFDIQGWIVCLSTFEEQLTVAVFAVRGWQRFNEVAHMLPPSLDRRRNERGTLKRVPSNSDFEESPTR
jgi:hypothetical protein